MEIRFNLTQLPSSVWFDFLVIDIVVALFVRKSRNKQRTYFFGGNGLFLINIMNEIRNIFMIEINNRCTILRKRNEQLLNNNKIYLRLIKKMKLAILFSKEVKSYVFIA